MKTTEPRPPHPSDEDLLTFHWEGGRSTGAHVAGCAPCTSRLFDLQGVLRAAEALPIPERGEAYGREVWARLAPKLAEPPRSRVRDRFAALFAPRLLVAAGTLAAVASAAFIAGRLAAPAPASTVATARLAADRVLYAELASHLDRSEAVLLELVHGSDPGPAGTLDVGAEQERLADLLPANRLYRQSADRSGQAAISSLLDELERVLLEVEHGPSQLKDSERDSLRRRIESEGILFRLRILSARVRRLERDAAPPSSTERKRV